MLLLRYLILQGDCKQRLTHPKCVLSDIFLVKIKTMQKINSYNYKLSEKNDSKKSSIEIKFNR